MDDKLIKELKESHYFEAFQSFVIDKINELDSISNSKVSGLSNEQAGELVKVNSVAIELLVEIFSPVINFREKQEHTEEEINQAKEKVGL